MTALPRRVLLVSPYALSVPGGAQSQVLAMALELRRREVDVVVCSPGSPREELRDAGVEHVAAGRVLRVPANGSRAPVTLDLRAASRFAQLAARMDDGVVHVHEPFAPVAAYRVLAQHRRPVVGTFHRGGVGPAYTAGRPVIRRLSRGLDVLVAVSEHAAATLREATGLEATTLFNGIDVDRYDRAVAAPTTKPTVVFLGRHEPRKGLSVLLEALGRLDVDLECWVLGTGPQTDTLRSRHAGDGRICWLGARSDAEVASRLKGADVLCVPSLFGESFGLVPLEGMAARTAVVASDIDGYRRATAGHATLVTPDDPAALADALRDALSHPASTAWLDAAYEHAASWSIAALVDRYAPLYAQATARFAERQPVGGSARR